MPLTNKTIFVAEDNATNQLVVRKMIEQLGGRVELASNGAEAIQNFDPDRFDLALLDIEMPEKDGMEVARYIRSRPDVSENFPIVALTAFVLDSHKRKIMSSGMNGIIAKPILDIAAFGQQLASYMANDDEHEHSQFNMGAVDDLKRQMGDGFDEIIGSIISDIDSARDELSSLSSPENLKKTAHKLLPLAQMVGGTELTQLAKDIEAGGEIRDASTLSEQFIKALDELRVHLETVL